MKVAAGMPQLESIAKSSYLATFGEMFGKMKSSKSRE